jgi:hypothetical protein
MSDLVHILDSQVLLTWVYYNKAARILRKVFSHAMIRIYIFIIAKILRKDA